MKTTFIIILLPILIFARQVEPEKWDTPHEISIINEYFPLGVNSPYINSEGNKLYFDVGGRVYYLRKIDSLWSAPILINEIPENIYAQSPKISTDNKKLFFLQNGPISKQLFYIQREEKDSSWSQVYNCGSNINNDSIFIEDYFLSGDTSLFIRNWSTVFCSNLDTLNNKWDQLKISPDFYDDFFIGNFGGTFIDSSYTKVYHTSSFLVWWIIDDHLYEIMRDYLAVSYKDINDRFGDEYLLNISTEIDSIYNSIIPDQNYFCSSPSLTRDGKYLFFAINYYDTIRVYSSELLSDVSYDSINSISKINAPVDDYLLMQNYPNPFNPTTKIEFQIAESGFVSLKVYDLLGREVETLVDEIKNPGRYKVTFNGKNLSNGIYIYRLKGGKYYYSRKMILMK